MIRTDPGVIGPRAASAFPISRPNRLIKKKPPNFTFIFTCVPIKANPMVSELHISCLGILQPDYIYFVSKISVTLLCNEVNSLIYPIPNFCPPCYAPVMHPVMHILYY
jgi:hypothetical protein